MSEHAQVLKGGHVVPHHFENAKQAFESSKLGLWVFLITELLLFGGLFVGYIILRSLYPDMFLAASTMLDRTWGAVNTVVLICSSFTVAMAIETIKQNKRGVTTLLLLITLVCAGIFMFVKYQEYHHKFEKGVAPISKLEDGSIHVGFDKFNHDLFKQYPNANLFLACTL